jgi:TetR/AcrR family transcriptional regulator, mexJK operon transcriptional repressor
MRAGEQISEPDARSVRKRRAILAAASEVFLREGYLGTNMDQIAQLAEVSKQTIYKHFSDKSTLFTEVVVTMVDEAGHVVHEQILALDHTGDLAADLRTLARHQLSLVMQPRLLRLRRTVIAEAARFPELGRTFYDRGPGRTIGTLATMFEKLAANRVLRLADAHLAATQFNWLVMADPLNRAMLLGVDETPSAADLDRYAEHAVRAFLAAYRDTGKPTT